ncbi:MAG: amidohydrolase family protein [Oceanospirillaceae bacterium]|nr:amidohydrolase family protein [Oceanospirillaceae bacterium]
MRVDAHQHFWQLSRGEYPWLSKDFSAIYRDFSAEQLQPLLVANQIDKSILVQAAATLAESQYLLDIAKAHDFVAGVVGWVDFEAADVASQIELLYQHGHSNEQSLLKGLRPMVQDIADPNWLLKPQLQAGITSMCERQLSFDALVLAHQLPVLAKFIEKYPDLPVVIDHAAKPSINSGEFKAWARDIALIAKNGKTFCKLSGLLTEAGDNFSVASLQPYVDHLLYCFGDERLVWGSDWPVLNLAADYHRWCEMTEQLLQGLTKAQRANIYGLNAIRFYRL